MNSKIGETIAFIPLRGGSKSIPLKNIKKINNRPLVYWVLDAVNACKEIDCIVISTDSVLIKETVEKYGSNKVTVIERSNKVSSDEATTESVMLEFSKNYAFENIILVQATSPLLETVHLCDGIKAYNEKNVDSVLSVVKQKRFIWEQQEFQAIPINYNPVNRPRRQEFNGFLVENGAFYITSRKKLLETKCRISGNIKCVEMPENSYYEIDEPSDWTIIEKILQNRNKETQLLKNFKKIKCLLTDSDGVLTDGGMYYSENGDELKKFNTKDGVGFRLLRENGYLTGIITGENVELVKRRANKMQVDILYSGIENKMEILNEICDKFNLRYDEIAYIGDDINDIEVIKAVGFSCVVKDGMENVKAEADYITEKNGGQGAVREIAELIIKHKSENMCE